MTQDSRDTSEHVYDIIGTILSVDRLTRGSSNEIYLPVTVQEFEPALALLSTRKFVLIGLFCIEDFMGVPGPSLLYHFPDCIMVRTGMPGRFRGRVCRGIRHPPALPPRNLPGGISSPEKIV